MKRIAARRVVLFNFVWVMLTICHAEASFYLRRDCFSKSQPPLTGAWFLALRLFGGWRSQIQGAQET